MSTAATHRPLPNSISFHKLLSNVSKVPSSVCLGGPEQNVITFSQGYEISNSLVFLWLKKHVEHGKKTVMSTKSQQTELP